MPTRAEVAHLIDHTLLRPDASEAEIDEAVGEAAGLGVYAVCVEARWLDRVVPRAHGAGVLVVTVAGFPTGLEASSVKAVEARDAVLKGADEVDMVADLKAIRSLDWGRVEREVAAVRESMNRAEPGKVLKVILETADFDGERVVGAALAAERGGADFVKTSTGFSPSGGASVEVVRLLAQVVGGRLGVKASGGIRSAAEARALLDAGATRLGTSRMRAILEEWGA